MLFPNNSRRLVQKTIPPCFSICRATFISTYVVMLWFDIGAHYTSEIRRHLVRRNLQAFASLCQRHLHHFLQAVEWAYSAAG